MSDLRKLNIDGQDIEVPAEYTLMQACEEAGAEIPRFCYHERLSIAGNCRMCLVEWVGAPKPQASCALQVKDLRPNRDGTPANIRTNSPVVKKAREGVMEFLLINHPLDCPICDQGGECDLQDQAMAYGRDGSRFEENKRAVDEKNMGPLVKTVMTRCIQCTRCVRFATEIAGVSELGLVSRGENAEITTYLEKSLTSELSGNVIDLCPVGALTSKPYAFNARPWELDKVETVDVMDAVGSNIRVDSRGGKVLRVMPRVHEGINEEWISDKTRFIWDGLFRQRLDRPYMKINGKLSAVSWDEAMGVAAGRLKGDPDRIAALAGDLADTESMFALKELIESLGVKHLDCRPAGSTLGDGPRESYIFNTSIEGIEDADALLMIGTNPRTEAPIINARIRKAWLHNGLEIGMVGEVSDLTYDYAHVGDDAEALEKLLTARGGFASKLRKAKNPMLIIGEGALARADSAAILNLAGKVADKFGIVSADWNGFNVLHNAASRVAGLDMGFTPGADGNDTAAILKSAKAGELDTLVLLSADELDTSALGDTFVIYIGTHGDAGAHRADLILPGATYTEKDALWVNTEGRVQAGMRAVHPKGEAKEDWAIIRALSGRLDRVLPYDDKQSLRAKLFEVAPTFARLDVIGSAAGGDFDVAKLGKSGKLDDAPFKNIISDFYLTNPIARASTVMAECSDLQSDNIIKEAAE